MAMTYSIAIVNARLAAVIATIGASPTLRIRTGAAPTHVADASTGTVLASCPLPSTWMATPASGSVAKQGTWEDTSADATGTGGHFEIVASDGTTIGMRGSVTATGGGGDMTVDNTSFATGQDFTVTGFTLLGANI